MSKIPDEIKSKILEKYPDGFVDMVTNSEKRSAASFGYQLAQEEVEKLKLHLEGMYANNKEGWGKVEKGEKEIERLKEEADILKERYFSADEIRQIQEAAYDAGYNAASEK